MLQVLLTKCVNIYCFRFPPVGRMAPLDAALLRLLAPPPTDLLHLLLQLLTALLLNLHGLHNRLCHLTTASEYKSVPARSQMGSLTGEMSLAASMFYHITFAKVQSMEYVQSPSVPPTLQLWPEPDSRDSMSEMMAELGTWQGGEKRIIWGCCRVFQVFKTRE